MSPRKAHFRSYIYGSTIGPAITGIVLLPGFGLTSIMAAFAVFGVFVGIPLFIRFVTQQGHPHAE